MKTRLLVFFALLASITVFAGELPEGYWPLEKSQPILDKTKTITLNPDLSGLTAGESAAVSHLLQAGGILHRIYLESRHPEALVAARNLRGLNKADGNKATRNLLELYRLSKGPIVTTLDNKREAFLPVAPETPTRNVYPKGATREEIDAYLEKHPEERASILGERTVVRRNEPGAIEGDLRTLARHPVLDGIHPGLKQKLQSLMGQSEKHSFYAVPQSVAWATELISVHRLLNNAADAIEGDDAEFARFLRNRSRDLLSDDYESGDAAWDTGRFKRLNAQIGSYETYDDALYGVKAFMSLSLLKRNEEASAKMAEAIESIQLVEDSLPYEHHKRVRRDIPVGVYEVIADFGQSRGRNTATILPNDALFSRRYGRTILLRENIMRNETLFANAKAAFDAVVAEEFRDDLTSGGGFNRTLWHEVGHYLGVDRTRDGRTIDDALESTADSYEEMKADLVSLFAAPTLEAVGYYDEAGLTSLYAGGIRRTLQSVKPRREQAYQTMQLMQFNYFIDKGLITFDKKSGVLSIHYEKYPETVKSLLSEVLDIQYQGDKAKAEAFMDRWTEWKDDLHGVIAKQRRQSAQFRSVIVKYGALGE